MKKFSMILVFAVLLTGAQSGLSAAPVTLAGGVHPPVAWFGWFKRNKKDDAQSAQPAAAGGSASAEQAGGLKAAELRKVAEDTLRLIRSKRGELEQVTALLKQIPLPEQMGAKAREYQKEVAALTGQIQELRQKAETTIGQLRAMGVPVDQLVASLNDMLAGDEAAAR